ncbi:hypothetical protein C9374_009775 [Naegleria lovaniensis]|uniref:Uncharacterized protein n=1 Tax=Naegleria lovaniensis TaxID=51637 RepID=A0AA88GY57_NAELO|nr:uncharacterized protein C9374_009775 [Naegleria lovaniensis]KAG2393198.1 hypothetical protein C9374_009775 [Naegleria lovaniensis]
MKRHLFRWSRTTSSAVKGSLCGSPISTCFSKLFSDKLVFGGAGPAYVKNNNSTNPTCSQSTVFDDNNTSRSFHMLARLLKDQSSGVSVSPPQQPTVNDSSNQLSVVLAFNNYEEWTAQQVASLLCMKKFDGGASLTVEDVKPLYDASFKGTSLANIVEDIKRDNYNYALEKLQSRFKDNTGMINPRLSDACETVVNWVNNTLMSKLFGLWDKNQVQSALQGGAGLTMDQVEPLYKKGFDGSSLSKIVYELCKSEQDGSALTDADLVKKVLGMEIDSSTGKHLVDWVKSVLIAQDKIQVPLLTTTLKLQSKQKKIQQFIQQFTTSPPKAISNIESISNILLSSFGTNFTFVDREQSTKIIVDNYKQYSSLIDQKGLDLDKKNIIIPFIAAAPGVGKSRLLKEIGFNLYRKHFREQVTCYPLFVSFGNGTAITATEKDRQLDITQSFIIRIVFSFICHINGKKENFLGIVSNWVATFENQILDLNEVLGAITSLLEKDNIDFFVAIDEAHQIDTNHTEKQHNPLRAFMSYLGSLLQNPQPDYWRLFPLLAGTYHNVLHRNLLGSTYTPLFVPVNALLSSLNVATVIDDLSNTHPKLRNWRTDVEFRHYLRLFSGFPRGLEYYLEQYVTQTEPTARTAYETSASNLRQKYSFTMNNNIAQNLVAYILTRQTVLKKDNIIRSINFTFSDAENLGFIMLDLAHNSSNFTCTYPPVLMYSMIDQQLRPIFEKLFLSTERKVCGFSWEDHVHDYLYLFFNLLSNRSNLSLNELFPFANMSEKTAKLTLKQIQNCKQCTAKHQIQGTLNEKIDTTNGLLDLTKVTDCTIIKNAASAQAGDVLIIGLKLQDSPNDILVFHIQCKWADSKKSSETFENISIEIEMNKKLYFNTKSKTTNITVIMSGKPITDLPKNIPDNVIIVDKTNFAKYFGIFADSMKFFCSKQILHINEVNASELQSFPRLDEQMAKYVMKSRPSTGFKNKKDMQRIIRTEISNRGIATKLINILNETEIIF